MEKYILQATSALFYLINRGNKVGMSAVLLPSAWPEFSQFENWGTMSEVKTSNLNVKRPAIKNAFRKLKG
jgi:hypothetical protein